MAAAMSSGKAIHSGKLFKKGLLKWYSKLAVLHPPTSCLYFYESSHVRCKSRRFVVCMLARVYPRYQCIQPAGCLVAIVKLTDTQDLVPKELIRLDQTLYVKPSKSEKSGCVTFDIASAEDTWTLAASSQAEYEEWVRALELVGVIRRTVSAVSAKSIWEFQALAADGSVVPLSTYKRRVVIIVNTASQCGACSCGACGPMHACTVLTLNSTCQDQLCSIATAICEVWTARTLCACNPGCSKTSGSLCWIACGILRSFLDNHIEEHARRKCHTT